MYNSRNLDAAPHQTGVGTEQSTLHFTCFATRNVSKSPTETSLSVRNGFWIFGIGIVAG
jgi:hypothetical protein